AVLERQIYEVGIGIADLRVFGIGQPQLNAEPLRSRYRQASFFVSVMFGQSAMERFVHREPRDPPRLWTRRIESVFVKLSDGGWQKTVHCFSPAVGTLSS